MDPISITGTLIAIVQLTGTLISICYDYRSSAKSATKEIAQITDELNALRDVLESLLRLVERREGDGEGLEVFRGLMDGKEGGVLGGCRVLLEGLRGRLEVDVGWRKVKQVLTWPMKEGEMRRALEALERLKATIQLALSADQTALSFAIKDDIGDLTQMFQRHSTDQHSRAIYAWIGGPDPFPNHAANRKKRQEYTGDWLVLSKQWDVWVSRSNSFLWLYGIPGSGKSVLCSTVIEQLVKHCHQVPGTAIAYFYFDFNEKRDIHAILRSLIRQLSSQSESTPLPLLEVYQQHGSGQRTVETSVLFELLRSIILIYQGVFIVLDALDESNEYEDVLEILHDIHSWELDRLHVVVTSRQLPDIEESLENIVTEKICLNESTVNKDIIIYVAHKLETDKALKKWPPEIRLQIQTKLLDEEGGMFQWVVCQLDMLRRCTSVNAIKKATYVLPKTLDQTYDRLLGSIDEMNQSEVMKVLQAITVTEDHLTLTELVELLAIDLEQDVPVFEPDSRLLDPKAILSMCSSLVTTGNEEQESTMYKDFIAMKISKSRPREPTLRLAHASVADYLTEPNPSGPSMFHFREGEARQFMGQSCLAYLLNPEFASGDNVHHTQLDRRLQTFPFLEHCAAYWPLYLKREQGEPEDHLTARTKEILQMFFATYKMPNGGNFAAWVRLLIPNSPSSHVQGTPPLYYCASYGLFEVVKIMLDTEPDIDIDAVGGRAHTTALHAAVYRDHTDVVRLLLERGANPAVYNDQGESTAYWARVNQNKEVQDLITQYGGKKPWSWDGHRGNYTVLLASSPSKLCKK